ncbi:actin-domain-containing protein [Abortiporus biennis]|nr:actin-domain-containing protein [Abortiporus biennis]
MLLNLEQVQVHASTLSIFLSTMSNVPTTPRRHAQISSATTPQTSRVAASHVVQSSPHYTTTRRHSLYGTEDRIILDPGSRVWKVGFSGEGKPRDVFLACGQEVNSLWSLSRAWKLSEREEEDRLLEARLQNCLRAVFHDSLLTDPKSRKVIICEHPLLPLHVKECIARILFNNLQVPSISFASSHLLALFASGNITGLVLDCGHLETTVLPIFSSRPLYPHLRTTPLAGARLSSHLRALLLLFGTYLPPPTSLSAAVSMPAASRSTRVPEEVLTDSVIEEIKTRCCFVGEIMDTSESHGATPAEDLGGESDLPPSDATMSESDFSRVSTDLVSNMSSHQGASSEFSVVSHSQAMSNLDRPQPGESHLQAIAKMYMRHSTATDLRMRVEPPVSQQVGTGRGTLIIPGWIRERASEVLFEGGDIDESSVVEVILDCLMKVPVDLRIQLVKRILIIGGTPMLPGFITRLRKELLRAVSPDNSSDQSPPPPSRPGKRPRIPNQGTKDKYSALRPLMVHLAIFNDPHPPSHPFPNLGEEDYRYCGGKVPAFTPASLAWVGGSLAGALKTGGMEVPREKWDEADAPSDEDDPMGSPVQTPSRSTQNVLPDWTRTPLSAGAPQAAVQRPQPTASSSPVAGSSSQLTFAASSQTAVGA